MVHMRIYTNDGWILATTKEQARDIKIEDNSVHALKTAYAIRHLNAKTEEFVSCTLKKRHTVYSI